MDAMFNNGHPTRSNNRASTNLSPDENDVIVDVVNDDDQPLSDALQASMNKRKLVNATMDNQGETNQNGNDTTKRLCTTNDRQ